MSRDLEGVDRYVRLEERVSLVEAEHAAARAELNELHGWRRRDEPRIAQLAEAAKIGDAVRQALKDAREGRWTLRRKLAAVAVGALACAGSVAQLLHNLGAL